MKRIGAHISAAGGIDKAVERAADIGCNCVQVFAGSPRGWRRPDLNSINSDLIRAKQVELGVNPIVTHSLYLVNLASDNPELLDKSVFAVTSDLQFDGLICGAGVVVHLGSHQGRGWETSREQLVGLIEKILKQTPANSRFLIENSAGQNGKVSSDLTEIRWLMDQLEVSGSWVSQNRLGWCFDTCHAHAAGYVLGREMNQEVLKTAEDLKNYQGLAQEAIDKLDLWSTLQVVHVNDSRDPFGAGRDRHDNIGEGQIPIDDLQYFLNLPELKNVPFITEAPGFDGKGPDKENIERLAYLVGSDDVFDSLDALEAGESEKEDKSKIDWLEEVEAFNNASYVKQIAQARQESEDRLYTSDQIKDIIS